MSKPNKKFPVRVGISLTIENERMLEYYVEKFYDTKTRIVNVALEKFFADHKEEKTKKDGGCE